MKRGKENTAISRIGRECAQVERFAQAAERAVDGLPVVAAFPAVRVDPRNDAVVEAEKQIREKRIRLLIYNVQTVSAITTREQDDARAAGIPVVGVTETMPRGETYQTWMLRQLDEVRTALGGSGS